VLILLALIAAPAWAQLPPINSTPNTVGSGARALGMGGAFIGVADDATAASWNPGGLTQLQEPEFSLVYSWGRAREEFSSISHPELEDTHSISLDSINYASFAYPLPWAPGGRNLVVSLNYQRKFDFDRDLDVAFNVRTAGSFFRADTRHRINVRADGSLSALSPAVAFELTNRLSVGVVANIWDQSLIPSNEWKTRKAFRSRTRINGGVPFWASGSIDEDYTDFKGTNWTIGALYKPTQRLSLGAVFNSKLAGEVKYRNTFRLRGGSTGMAITNEDRRFEFPSSIGVGAAYRFPGDKFTLSLDVKRTEWDQFVEVDRAGRRTSPITGLAKSITEHDPTYTVRLGGEYVFFDETKPARKFLPTLRAGVFYDPEPSGGRPNTIWSKALPKKGDGEPEDYYGVTLGAGLLAWNRVNFDIAYEYRWGSDVRTDTFGTYKTSADVDQHRLFASTVIYFGKGGS
jgi:long-subunit fatty acid transport protein